MKKNLKLLVLSVFAALSFSVPDGVWGMDELSASTQDNKRPYTMAFSDGQICPEETERKMRKLGEIKVNPFEQCPEEIKLHILKHATVVLLDSGAVGKLSAVSKEWQSFVKGHKIDIFKFAVCETFPADEETCKRFLNGKLIYKPHRNNDDGKIELKIADLTNPLGGTFDLSRCGDTGNYLSISTGYRTGKKPENANKVEIWFTPRFLVEKEIDGSARHFQSVFPASWSTSASVSIFWTWGGMG